MLTKPNLARIALVAAVVAALAAAAVVAASAAAAMVAVAATAKSANPGGNQTQALDSNHLSFESPRRVVRKRTLPTATGLALRINRGQCSKSTVAHNQKEFMNFSQLGLAPAQVRACESLGYTEPTPIQRQAIPVVLEGRDLIGCAETGTGKTAAFLLPIIQRLSERAIPGVRVLVLAPTRELAMQIEKNYGELNRVKANRGVTVIGGANMRTQISDLRRGAAIVIATPGRLLD